MSTDRPYSPTKPLRPTLASNRPARTPLTPRVAANATPPTKSSAPRATPTPKSEPPTPRVKAINTPLNNALANGNVTPRSSARASRVDSASASPVVGNGTPRAKSAIVTASPGTPSGGNPGGLGITNGDQVKVRTNRPRSLISDNGSNAKTHSPSVRSSGLADMSPRSPGDLIESRFFHASDAPKQEEFVSKKQEPKKAAAFFYADGQEEGHAINLGGNASPVLSAVSEQRSAGPWFRPGNTSDVITHSPLASPGLSTLSDASSFFTPAVRPPLRQRSPSPSKESIHLSYRKGVSQIFGTRPLSTQHSIGSNADLSQTTTSGKRRISNASASSIAFTHHKSPSLSSIESGVSSQSRRRSATAIDIDPSPLPLTQEFKSATLPLVAKPRSHLPTIDTSLESPGPLSPAESALSPSKRVSELAAEARRERKVLDLEISNSSLLAINASLEREVSRQKAELKCFRRLSRAGRFSLAASERPSRISSGLSEVDEEDENHDGVSTMFGLASGLSEPYDDMSDDDESILSSTEPLSPNAQSKRATDRLANDEKRLRVDMEKHKELLVQSQAVNQSIKRCMYAAEEMISEGKKALEYHVRVSDIKLGGRVLSSHEDEDDHQLIEVEEEEPHDNLDQAKGFFDVWASVGRPSFFEEAECGDRDSGIEVEKPLYASLPFAYQSSTGADFGRPPGHAMLGARSETFS